MGQRPVERVGGGREARRQDGARAIPHVKGLARLEGHRLHHWVHLPRRNCGRRHFLHADPFVVGFVSVKA